MAGPLGVDRDELDQFLATAPDSLRPWTEAQREAISEAPTLDDLEDDAILDEDELRPSTKGEGKVNQTARGINKVLVALLAAAIVIIVQQFGKPAEPQAAQAPHGDMGAASAVPGVTFAPLDEEKVSELEKKLESDADDVDTLRQLAKLHDDAGLWQEANGYQARILEQHPDDFDALLADGVFKFNAGDIEGAERQWVRATEVKPGDPEGYYNLGFVHMAKEPADVDKARAAWEKLIEVAPESELAKTASQHIDRMAEGD